MKAFMNRETVEVNIKEQLAQLISKYNASQQSLADNVRALNQKYKEDVQAKTYTVKPGDCLYNISKSTLGDGGRYNEIYSLNKDKLKNPNLIYPGQVLQLP